MVRWVGQACRRWYAPCLKKGNYELSLLKHDHESALVALLMPNVALGHRPYRAKA